MLVSGKGHSVYSGTDCSDQWDDCQQRHGRDRHTHRSLNTEFKDLRPSTERLALGANLKQASQTLIVNAIKTGMAPTIDSAKTVGLVSLPGNDVRRFCRYRSYQSHYVSDHGNLRRC